MGADNDQPAGVIPHHVQHWDAHRSSGYLGEPFADRSGGLIVYEALDLGAAEAIVHGDPFVEGGHLSQWWLKEWAAR